MTQSASAAADEPAALFARPDLLFGLEVKEPWATFILNGVKTIETRTYNLPPQLLGRPMVLLATPADGFGGGPGGGAGVSRLGHTCDAGKALAVGVVTFGECMQWESRKAWEADVEKHRVPSNDPAFEAFAWKRDEDTGEAALVRTARGHLLLRLCFPDNLVSGVFWQPHCICPCSIRPSSIRPSS
jgi:hypothetical protein